MESKRCTIAFSGRRDNFEVAKAYRDGGWEVTLVTDTPVSPRSAVFPLPSRIKDRLLLATAELEGIHVHCATEIVAEKLLRRALGKNWSSVWSAERLGRVAAKVANHRGGLMVSYSTYAYEALARCRPDVRRLLFQMHPHADACVNIVEGISGLKRGRDQNVEWEFRLPERSFQGYRNEWRWAEGILAASGYTKRTLMAAGAEADTIAVIPYGATDHGVAPEEPLRNPQDEVVRLLFVGSFVRRKGALILAEAARRARNPRLEIHACGRGLAEPEVVNAFSAAGIAMHRDMPDIELRKLRAACDAFMFPSLLEGFGHVVLESMLQGLPVIATERTCAPDLIVEGEHGWVLPAGEIGPLEERIAWCANHKGRLREMRPIVRNRALEFNWARFRRGVVEATDRLLARPV